jgi:hypothetical protein
MCRLSWSGSLNLLELSGPVQACNGIAFTLTRPQCGQRFADGQKTESCLFLIGDKKTRVRSVYLALYWNRPQGRIIQVPSQLSALTTAVVYGASQHELKAGSELPAGPIPVQRWTLGDLSFRVDTVTLLVTIRTVLANDRIKSNQSGSESFFWGESCRRKAAKMRAVWLLHVDCVWNVMAHAQKPDFFFRRHGPVHLNRGGGGRGVSSVDYWQPRCAHQR